MNIYSIYKIINKINNKLYIGFTSKTIEHRFKNHIKDSKNRKFAISNAIQKYGPENFIIEAIYQSYDSEHTLNTMESHFIAEYNTYNGPGYNMTEGGQSSMLNRHHSFETKQKLSKMNTGKNHPQYGIPRSKKLCREQSIRVSGINHPMFGKKRSLETNKKQSVSMMGKNAKKCSVDGKIFSSYQLAADYYNMSIDRCYYRLNNDKFNNWIKI